jgi:hypothetical protein
MKHIMHDKPLNAQELVRLLQDRISRKPADAGSRVYVGCFTDQGVTLTAVGAVNFTLTGQVVLTLTDE